MSTTRKVLRCICIAVIAAVAVNTLWVIAETSKGDAWNGIQANGHCFVFVKGKPNYVEVSQATWEWLRFHMASMLVTMPIGIGSVVVLNTAGFFRRGVSGTATAQEAAGRVEAVRRSGGILASARGSVKLGNVFVARPFAKVRVYPGGIVVKPWSMAGHVVLASEIRGISSSGKGFLGPTAWDIEIAHDGVDMPSPLRLYRSIGRIRSALQRVAAVDQG